MEVIQNPQRFDDLGLPTAFFACPLIFFGHILISHTLPQNQHDYQRQDIVIQNKHKYDAEPDITETPKDFLFGL